MIFCCGAFASAMCVAVIPSSVPISMIGPPCCDDCRTRSMSSSRPSGSTVQDCGSKSARTCRGGAGRLSPSCARRCFGRNGRSASRSTLWPSAETSDWPTAGCFIDESGIGINFKGQLMSGDKPGAVLQSLLQPPAPQAAGQRGLLPNMLFHPPIHGEQNAPARGAVRLVQLNGAAVLHEL